MAYCWKMAEAVTRFPCPYLNGEVELTAEREQHIADNHPDLLPEYRSGITETLLGPDEIRRSRQFSNALLFSKRYEDALGGKNIVIVVMTGADSNDRHWIITAYLARKLAGGETIWNKN